MSKLLIKQRVFSWTDTYDVYDENEQPKYDVKAEMFTIGHQIHVHNRETGQQVGIIHQKILTLLPKFEMEINGQIVGEIRKELTLFRPKYTIDCKGWEVEGDFLGWDYTVTEGGRRILHISKELLHWGDTYVMEYDRKEDEIMGLLLLIAIDAANCGNG